MNIKLSSVKLVFCGSIVERYEYLDSWSWGLKLPPRASFDRPKRGITPQSSLQRAKRSIRRLVYCNPNLNKFVTLTFAKNVKSLPYANQQFNLFVKRVKYAYPDFEYIAVPEFQKRGAVHYHLLCNLPFVAPEALAALWSFGFVKVNRIFGDVTLVASYITKYLTKGGVDKRLFLKKKYFCSRSLKRPIIFYNDGFVNAIHQIYDFSAENAHRIYTLTADFVGRIIYSVYKDVPFLGFN